MVCSLPRAHILRKLDLHKLTSFLAIDLFLANVLDAIPSSSKLTVLYTTTPPMAAEAEHLEKPSTYEMDDSMSPMHMDLKRDVSFEARQDAGNITLVDGPLFERYQYFTPGKCSPSFRSVLIGSPNGFRDIHGRSGNVLHPVNRLCRSKCFAESSSLIRGLR